MNFSVKMMKHMLMRSPMKSLCHPPFAVLASCVSKTNLTTYQWLISDRKWPYTWNSLSPLSSTRKCQCIMHEVICWIVKYCTKHDPLSCMMCLLLHHWLWMISWSPLGTRDVPGMHILHKPGYNAVMVFANVSCSFSPITCPVCVIWWILMTQTVT